MPAYYSWEVFRGPSRAGGGAEDNYFTDFNLTENPISEGGNWSKNGSNAWTVMKTESGVCVGTQIDDSYDDSYASKTGNWDSNYVLDAIIWRSPSIGAMNHEVELNVRFADDADSVRGYETLLNKDGTLQCFRWNDSFGSFTEIAAVGSPSVGSVPDGARYRLNILGDLITAQYAADGGAVSTICTFDIGSISGTKYTTGNPAIGSFCRPSSEGGNPNHFGFRSLLITRQ